MTNDVTQRCDTSLVADEIKAAFKHVTDRLSFIEDHSSTGPNGEEKCGYENGPSYIAIQKGCAALDVLSQHIDSLTLKLGVAVEALEKFGCYCNDPAYRSVEPCMCCEALKEIQKEV